MIYTLQFIYSQKQLIFSLSDPQNFASLHRISAKAHEKINLGHPEINSSTKTTLATMMMSTDRFIPTLNAERDLPIDMSPPSYRRASQSDI